MNPPHRGIQDLKTMNITTPALLFPAISLLLLAYSNRFLSLAQVIRQLHASPERGLTLVDRQIPGLKQRIVMIKYMQGFGVLSFLLCALSMLSLIEVLLSTNALEIVVEDLQRPSDRRIVSDEDDEPADGRI